MRDVGRWWCIERCSLGHEWTWLYEEGMALDGKWPCGCPTHCATVVLKQWPEGCLTVQEKVDGIKEGGHGVEDVYIGERSG